MSMIKIMQLVELAIKAINKLSESIDKQTAALEKNTQAISRSNWHPPGLG